MNINVNPHVYIKTVANDKILLDLVLDNPNMSIQAMKKYVEHYD
jgi:hypothetical protein